MSGSQKAVKVVSIISIVFGVIGLLLGIMMIAGAGLLNGQTIEAEGEVFNASIAAIAFGILFFVSSVLSIVIGALGVRGANDPSKIGPFYVICWIDVVLEVIQFVGNLATGSGAAASIGYLIGGLIIPVILIILCKKIKEQA